MSHRKLGFLLFLFVFGVSLAGARWMNARLPLDTDDAYITYRYSKNIAEGDGFVYNRGERVLGTTTPLYTLLLAGLARAGVDIPVASAWVNELSVALTLALIFAWVSRRSGSILGGLIAASLPLMLPDFVNYVLSGMETSFYILLIFACFYCYDRDWLVPAAFVAGLCFLTRFDGAAVGAALVLHYTLARFRLPPSWLWLTYGLVIVPWLIFSWQYFGDIRPQSMMAKHTHDLLENRWWMLRYIFLMPVVMLWPLAVIGVRGALDQVRGGGGLAGLAVWLALYVAAYSIYRIDLYRWYLSPAAAGLAALAGMGFAWAFSSLTRQSDPAPRRPLSGAWLLALAALAPLATTMVRDAKRSTDAMVSWTHGVEGARANLVQHILERGSPNDVIATGAIGIVGWRATGPIYDLLRLVTRGPVSMPLDRALEESRARWYISETSSSGAELPRVAGFVLRETFGGGAGMPLFLLYERSDVASPVVAETNQAPMELGGIAIGASWLTPNTIEITATPSVAIPRPLKWFVHIFESAGASTPMAQADFAPATATDRMQTGVAYRDIVRLPDTAGFDVVIRLGLFDESDPALARLRSAGGADHIEVRRAASAAGPNLSASRTSEAPSSLPAAAAPLQ